MDPVANTVKDVRAFNRFYIRWVGALDTHYLGSDFSLAQVRVLYEIAHFPGRRARDVAEALGLDGGYLSRMLGGFETLRLVERRRSPDDARASALHLTPAGNRMFRDLDRRAAGRVGEAVEGLDDQQRARLSSAMGIIRHLLGFRTVQPATGATLRQPRPGDYGWAIERHGVIYDTEFGWDARFEGLVAELFGQFARNHDPSRERCWIADLNGERVGCVFIVERERDVAQLRCLLVEPKARGRGVGKALVDACIEFARAAGYSRMMLWTNKGLDSARKIYEAVGFRLIEEQRHRDFGPELIGQNWELAL